MRIYVMTDLEGVCGVMNFEDWCEPASRYYERGAREFLTLEVNAAIEGFKEAGGTEFLVADGHGYGALNPALLHPAAELARGWTPSYPFSLDDGHFDAAAWVGQHAKAGTTYAHLAHTGSFGVRDDSINGLSVGEFGDLALCAGELGVPVIFASGDEAFAREAQALIPGIETAAVKRGLNPDPGHELPDDAYGRFNLAAIHLSLDQARAAIRQGAQRALKRFRERSFGLLRPLKAPYRRVRVLRSNADHPPRALIAEHPTSLIGLMNSQGALSPITQADPLEISRASR